LRDGERQAEEGRKRRVEIERLREGGGQTEVSAEGCIDSQTEGGQESVTHIDERG
jgi:hypothetical protein